MSDELRERVARLERENAALRAALDGLFRAIETGEMVRNVERDGEASWALRMVKLTKTLADAQQALANTAAVPVVPPPEGVFGFVKMVPLVDAEKLADILAAVVAHADLRQAVATAGRPVGTEELYRLDEPEFVERARTVLAAWRAAREGGK